MEVGGEFISRQHYKPHVLIINYMSSRNICRYLLQHQGFYPCLVTAPKSVKNPNDKCWSLGKKSKRHIYRNSAAISASAPFYRFCSHPLESQEPSCPRSSESFPLAPQGDVRLIKIIRFVAISLKSLEKHTQTTLCSSGLLRKRRKKGRCCSGDLKGGRKGRFQEIRRN